MRALSFLFLLALPLHAQEADTLPSGTTSAPQALLQDAGMARIDSFSIDLYEYPNQPGVLPTVNVTWEEARARCQARGKRLCTEAEWEQACRGPEGHLYGYGPAFEPGRCNTPYPAEAGTWHRGRGPAPSGQFAGCASPYGVHDLVGNVWEWTDGWYDRPQGWRVVRGGSWFNNVNLARADGRYGRFLTADYRLDLIGFRCCR